MCGYFFGKARWDLRHHSPFAALQQLNYPFRRGVGRHPQKSRNETCWSRGSKLTIIVGCGVEIHGIKVGEEWGIWLSLPLARSIDRRGPLLAGSSLPLDQLQDNITAPTININSQIYTIFLRLSCCAHAVILALYKM